MILLRLILGFFTLVAVFAGVLFIIGKTTPRYYYEFEVEVLVDGEHVILRTGRRCSPGWEMGIPGGTPRYGGLDFSIGARLPSGRGVYVDVPDFCRGEFSPSRLDWRELALGSPFDISGTSLTIFTSDNFDNPSEFIFPIRNNAEPYQYADPQIELVHASWQPLEKYEIKSTDIPNIRLDTPSSYEKLRLSGYSFLPVSTGYLGKVEELIWLDTTGRYALYSIPHDVEMDFRLLYARKTPDIEDIRQSLPILQRRRYPDGLPLTNTDLGKTIMQDQVSVVDVSMPMIFDEWMRANRKLEQELTLGSNGKLQFHVYHYGFSTSSGWSEPNLMINNQYVDVLQKFVRFGALALHDKEADIFYMPYEISYEFRIPNPSAYH